MIQAGVHDAFFRQYKGLVVPFADIEVAISALNKGGMLIVVDDEDRENEGDFVCAAETVTSEQVDFMLKVGRGTMCVPMSTVDAQRLDLKPVVGAQDNTACFKTAFLTTVDHCDAGTGVSAENRAKTIRELANPLAKPTDFVRPGHMSPLMAMDGGVLRRAGHTEATVDLLRLAGRRSVGVIIEICSQRSHGMADLSELQAISKEHGIPIISIEGLIRYRHTRERLVSRIAEATIPTAKFGTPRLVCFRVAHEAQEPLAIVWGDLITHEAPLVRMHSSCLAADLLDSLHSERGSQLHSAMAMIHNAGAGAVVYLPQESRGTDLVSRLKSRETEEENRAPIEINPGSSKVDIRDYMVGLQILKDLGLKEVRLLTNSPKKTDAFVYSAFDLKLIEQVPIVASPR